MYSHPLELIFIDIWGPSLLPLMTLTIIFLFFMLIQNVYGYTSLLISLMLKLFSNLSNYTQKHTGFQIKTIQTDNEKKKNSCLLNPFLLLMESNITCPYADEQNGSIERNHKHYMGLALLASAKLPISFWGDAVNIMNVLPTLVLNYNNPYQMMFHKQPNYVFFKTFGCVYYPLLRSYNTHKFDFRSSMCLFVGYSSAHKGYLCMSLSGKTYVTKYFIFNEYVFPFALSDNPFKL